MEEVKEEQKRKILRFLGERYIENQKHFFSDDIIARYCEMDKNLVLEICTDLGNEGFVQNGKGSRENSYKITTNGLILLESYSTGGSAGRTLLPLTQIAKLSLARMQMINSELQTGVEEVGKKHNLRDGLYYVVMLDLVGSTAVSSQMNGAMFNDWIKKFILITKDALNTRKRSLAVFVKSVGDGALFLFRNFNDILDWKNKVDESCSYHNERCKKEGRLDFHRYHYKTIIHLGEIYFDRTNYDANAFGVSLVFKIEKKFGKDEIGITDVVRQTILQEINSRKFIVNNAGSYSLDESGNVVIPLWKLIPEG